MQNKVIYPGTFDPITYGHVSIIERAARLFDHVVVAIAANTHKKTTLFSVDERVTMARDVLKHLSNVSVCNFQGLLLDFVKNQQSRIILRGLRAVADFEFELQLASMHQQLASEIETIFLMPSVQYAHVSSTLIREMASLGSDVSMFVPEAVSKALLKHFSRKKA